MRHLELDVLSEAATRALTANGLRTTDQRHQTTRAFVPYCILVFECVSSFIVWHRISGNSPDGVLPSELVNYIIDTCGGVPLDSESKISPNTAETQIVIFAR